jgi:subtilisin family serine protease
MKKLAVFAAVAFFCSLLLLNGPVRSQGKSKLHRKANKIQNNYIVVLDDAVVGEKGPYSIAPYMAKDMAGAYRGNLKQVFQHALNGFSVEMSEEEALRLSDDYRVKFVEEDAVMTADTTQNGATWGIDRIDQRNRPLNGTYTYNWTGAGVRAYIIDTGIRTIHSSAAELRMCSMPLVAMVRTVMAMARMWPVLSADRPTEWRRAHC